MADSQTSPQNDLLSIVVPCYNEEAGLALFVEELFKILVTIDINSEVLLVDDGSKDGTLNIMRALAQAGTPAPNIALRYLSFSRNFGKESAIYAGLSESRGDFVVTIDADMQDPPSLLPTMLEKVRSGSCDSVATRRVDRAGEPPIRSFFARTFYRMINKMTKLEIVDGARDYRLMNRKMVNAVLAISEKTRFSKGIFAWVGFRTEYLEFENVERIAGETKWNFFSLFTYALDGIFAFSSYPLTIVSSIGLALFAFSIVALLAIWVRAMLFGDPVSGWPSLACIITFLGGIQLLCVSVLGQYLSRVYIEVKDRPIYVIGESSEDFRKADLDATSKRSS